MTAYSVQRKQRLLELLNDGWMTSASLAAAADTSWETATSASQLLRRLADAGLVTSRPIGPAHPQARQSTPLIREYALTDAGRAALTAGAPA